MRLALLGLFATSLLSQTPDPAYESLSKAFDALRARDYDTRRSPDDSIASEAQQAWSNLRPNFARFRTTLWMYPLYSSRWSDLFGCGQVKTEIRVARLPFRPYVSLRFIGDARRSTGGVLPQSLSESAFIVGAGVATRQWRGVMAGPKPGRPSVIDGKPWPVLSAASLHIPSGAHMIEPAGKRDEIGTIDLNATLKAASVEGNRAAFDYASAGRAIVRFSRTPHELSIGGVPAQPACEAAGECSVLLPRGEHRVLAR